MKNYNMIVIGKQQKCRHYHKVKLMNMNVLQMKKILLSDQRRVIEQARFTYSSLGKNLEKQTKTVEDQGKKQIAAIEYHVKYMVESNALINKSYYDNENKLFLKEKEVYDEIVAEIKNDINTLNNKIENDELTYHFKIEDRIPISFKSFNRPLSPIRKVKGRSIYLENS